MAYCLNLVLVLSALQLVLSSNVPVFIWGDIPTSTVKSNPLFGVSGDDFSVLFQRELEEDPFTVIFVEETLSVEDFSRRNFDGKTSFPYLHKNLKKSVYLPSVESPLDTLTSIADPEKVDRVKLTENGLSAEIEPESGKILFINLNDAQEGESRADLLKKHNDFMENLVGKLRARYNKVIAVFTSQFPSWTVDSTHSRVRREAESNNNGTTITANGLLLTAEQIDLQDTESIVLKDLVSSNTVVNDSLLEVELNFGQRSLNLMFNYSAGYWLFNQIQYIKGGVTEDLVGETEVYALDGFSYRCASNVKFTTINATSTVVVTFKNLKIEPFLSKANTSEGLTFGDSFNCVGFFSAPIWAGLFVTFILLFITFYGIMMMMDIRTMDRFDDPKGKTITVNVSE